MATFETRFTVNIELELSERLLKEVMSPEWQENFYEFADHQSVCNHIAYNLARGASLTSLDGFANFDDSDVVVKSEDWDV
jgi:hypothetical protein